MGVTLLGIRQTIERAIAGPQQWLRLPSIHVRRRELPYWQERGWRRSGDTYTGSYQTPYGSFLGSVEDRGYGSFRFYIIDPPQALRASSHWSCFQPRGHKGFHVHMARRPRDISAGIMTIERLITDAFEA